MMDCKTILFGMMAGRRSRLCHCSRQAVSIPGFKVLRLIENKQGYRFVSPRDLYDTETHMESSDPIVNLQDSSSN